MTLILKAPDIQKINVTFWVVVKDLKPSNLISHILLCCPDFLLSGVSKDDAKIKDEKLARRCKPKRVVWPPFN